MWKSELQLADIFAGTVNGRHESMTSDQNYLQEKLCFFLGGALQGPKRVLRCPKVLHVSMVIFWCPGRQACQTETHATCLPVAIVQRIDKISLLYDTKVSWDHVQVNLIYFFLLFCSQPTYSKQTEKQRKQSTQSFYLFFNGKPWIQSICEYIDPYANVMLATSSCT